MLDMSDVLNDPDFSQTFTVTRSVETVNLKGRGETSLEVIPASGVLVPATPRQLARLPEADRSSEIIAVYSREPLTPGSDTFKPDLVTWRGRNYRVVSLDDYADYGGWCVALAAACDMQGREP